MGRPKRKRVRASEEQSSPNSSKVSPKIKDRGVAKKRKLGSVEVKEVEVDKNKSFRRSSQTRAGKEAENTSKRRSRRISLGSKSSESSNVSQPSSSGSSTSSKSSKRANKRNVAIEKGKKQVKCKSCKHHWRTEGCKLRLCRRCCKKRPKGFCRKHEELERAEFDELKAKVLSNLESYGSIQEKRAVRKSCGLEDSLKNYGETATIFCFQDFVQQSKFSKECLNPNSRKNRSIVATLCKNQCHSHKDRNEKMSQRFNAVLKNLKAA
mmetsp:Transcript_11456/g.13138  ORF Transcript_11456/g.13138 Transcript_11456/m.13138 type:complete len:266 (+) Transcript_11456:95-892(+)|eukprot:CAMPEP_0184055992 /NCGR_PEP_ID=MMETSP0956-20121227/7509_1 /TAXON_ID=627963 /ORGANISM="Aplanochytrium sp, Strain PBS07" /LENGTH=265 /DNA_ID=CAMNT_0026349927 /DNA_START=51 /DNA_END=848 /DNA_ORIENTATION=-